MPNPSFFSTLSHGKRKPILMSSSRKLLPLKRTVLSGKPSTRRNQLPTPSASSLLVVLLKMRKSQSTISKKPFQPSKTKSSQLISPFSTRFDYKHNNLVYFNCPNYFSNIKPKKNLLLHSFPLSSLYNLLSISILK